MSAIELHDNGTEQWVDPTDLICPACVEPVVGEPPREWPASAGERPDFTHVADGSVLCPDAHGGIGEPVESSVLRFGLSEAGETALDAEARS